MNSRRYPRTLADAFKGVDYACALERPAPSRLTRAACVLLLAAAAVLLLALKG